MKLDDPRKVLIAVVAVSVVLGGATLYWATSRRVVASPQVASPTSTPPPASTDPNAPTGAQNLATFSYPDFQTRIMLHTNPDSAGVVQYLAGRTTAEYWDKTVMNSGCIEGGYAAQPSAATVLAYIDGYTFPQGVVEASLERGGLRASQTFNITLVNSPWGNIDRSLTCISNTDQMQQIVSYGDYHGALSIPVAQRTCTRWTFANQYQADIPGKGTVKVFSGKFEYSMTPLLSGVTFTGNGTASVKMYLDPDNGQWTVVSFEKNDPSGLTLGNLSGPKIASTTPSDYCPGP